MTNLFKNYNNYGQALLWLDEAKAREAKKQNVQAAIQVQSTVLDKAATCLQAEQVIFTRADVGHNGEETQKIQEIYHELEEAPRLPIYALA